MQRSKRSEKGLPSTGQSVQVTRGPFQGRTGIVEGRGWKKSTVSVRLDPEGIQLLATPEELLVIQSKESQGPSSEKQGHGSGVGILHEGVRLPRFSTGELSERQLQKHEFIKGQVGSFQVRLWQRPTDIIGNRLWPCSLLLSAYITSVLGPNAFTGRRVIELGSGPGLVGICAQKLGADTILTDLGDVVELLSKNTEANADPVESGGAPFQVAEFAWGSEIAPLGSAPFDYVLASDVVYCEYAYDGLLQSLVDLATPGVTTILLAYKPRWADADALFFSRLSDSLLVEDIGTDWVHRDDRHFTADMRIYRCLAKSQAQ